MGEEHRKKAKMSVWVDPKLLEGLRELSERTGAPQSAFYGLGLERVLEAAEKLGENAVFSDVAEAVRVEVSETPKQNTADIEKLVLWRIRGASKPPSFKEVVEFVGNTPHVRKVVRSLLARGTIYTGVKWELRIATGEESE